MMTSGMQSSEAIGLWIEDMEQVDDHYVVWGTGKDGAQQRVKLKAQAFKRITTYCAAAGIISGAVFWLMY